MHALRESTIRLGAELAILVTPMFTSEQLGKILVIGIDNNIEAALLRAKTILAIPTMVGYRYPQFQFDTSTASVRPAVAEVNQLLDAANDPWGVASWWLTPSARLTGGLTPANLAMSHDPTQRTRVYTLAASLLE